MKAEEFLKQVSQLDKHRMSSIPFGEDLELVIDAMEEYATMKNIVLGKLLEKKELEIKLYKKELSLCYVELNKLEYLRKD